MMYFNRKKQHYYKIETTINYFKNSPKSLEYLQGVIEKSSPDMFHWTDIDEANKYWEKEI